MGCVGRVEGGRRGKEGVGVRGIRGGEEKERWRGGSVGCVEGTGVKWWGGKETGGRGRGGEQRGGGERGGEQ